MQVSGKTFLRYLLLLSLAVLAGSLALGPAAAQSCLPDGDVDQDGQLTTTDAVLAFQHFLGLATPPLSACQQARANVEAPETSAVTPEDTLCIFRRVSGLPSCLDAPGRPGGLRVVGEDDVHVVVRAPLQLVARVVDVAGIPVPGASVTFRRTAGTGTLTDAQSVTDTSGEAATQLTLTTATETTCVEASVAGLPPVVFASTGVAAEDLRLIEAGGNHQQVAPGQELNTPIIVRIETQTGNPLAGRACGQQSEQPVTNETPQAPNTGLPVAGVRVQATILGGASLVTAPEAVTNVQGKAAFRIQVGETTTEDVVTQVAAFDQSVDFLTTVDVDVLPSIVRLVNPEDIAVEANGSLVVTDSRIGGVARIDPSTRMISLVSGLGRGTGPAILPFGLAVEANGSLVVMEGFDAIVRIDPVSGNRTIVSDETTGSGPSLSSSMTIAVEADGSLVVVGAALVRINPTTGDRTLVSGCSTGEHFANDCPAEAQVIGSGPFFQVGSFPALAVESDGSLVVTDGGRVLRVHPVTGDRSVVSGCTTGDKFGNCTGEVMGTGPLFNNLTAVVLEANGSLVVPDASRIIRIDPLTGDRTLVSDEGDLGPSLDSPPGLAVEADGSLVVIRNVFSGEVVRIDPITGERTALRDDSVDHGPPFGGLRAVAVEATGSLVVIDDGLMEVDSRGAGVMRVDALTGDRVVVSDATIGTGSPFLSPQDIAVEANGQLLVVDSARQAIIRVDPDTGDRTTVAGCTTDAVDESSTCLGDIVGSGEALVSPQAIAVEASGSLVVLDMFLRIVRVDPVNGNRTLVSDAIDTVGPTDDAAIAVAADGFLVVTGSQRIVRVDPNTGDVSIVSGCTTQDTGDCPGDVRGGGPDFGFLEGITVTADGSLMVIDRSGVAVVRVDPNIGDRTTISGCSAIGTPASFCIGDIIGSGQPLLSLKDLTVDASGSLIAMDSEFATLIRIDRSSGNRTIIAR